MKNYDLAIIGGGIMGLMSAYFALENNSSVVILEKRTIGNKQAASFSYTRTFRTDYLDSFYAGLANQSRQLWLDLQSKADKKLLVEAGCLNIAKKSITPDLDKTYGAKSYQVISDLGYEPEKFPKNQLMDNFPQFDADAGWLDTKGGYLDLPAITEFLLRELKARNVNIIENVDITSIENTKIASNKGEFIADKIIITAGVWTNEVLQLVRNNQLVLPLSFDKPKECKYYYPKNADDYLPDKFPVFAYLDLGIYGHPIFDKVKGALKISYYNPTDLEVVENGRIQSVADFVDECLPDLKNARCENVVDGDQCYYDLVSDDNFILGKLPGFENIFVACGWRGTGYKFAPLVGKIMSQLAAQNETEYEIGEFNPERFNK